MTAVIVQTVWLKVLMAVMRFTTTSKKTAMRDDDEEDSVYDGETGMNWTM